ncbi:TetR/AcrR family transcriptional regulator [Poseidonibacter sp.]|uniref:TetR/AcrR family transcriptional regulator n=1 Tax=Poseidonibacter sp. TaxID=2321188 RepID=UPI003C75EF98
MAVKKTSKEDILQNSIKLFKQNGYYNTSMANIASECGLIKGSIYHHFKSKDEIGLEALKFIHKYFEENIFKIAYKTNLDAKEKIKLFVKKTDEYFLNSEGGCLLGNLALELSNENVLFNDEIRLYFSAWEKALVNILKDKYNESESLELAKEYVALTQGSIMMMQLYSSTDSYLKVGKKLTSLL